MPTAVGPLTSLLFFGACSFFVSSCAVGARHTSDAALEQVFLEHESEFRILLADVQADTKLTALRPGWLSYGGRTFNPDNGDFSEIEQAGLIRQQWLKYRDHLQALGLAGGVYKGEGRVEFRVDQGSMFNGDSYKGYEYTQVQPDHLESSLDGYRKVDSGKERLRDWFIHKKLKGNWYLYLFVHR